MSLRQRQLNIGKNIIISDEETFHLIGTITKKKSRFGVPENKTQIIEKFNFLCFEGILTSDVFLKFLQFEFILA